MDPMTALQELTSVGWDGLEGVGPKMDAATRAMASKRRDIALAVARLFATDDGRVVLDWLRSETVGRDMVPIQVGHQEPITFEQMAPYVTMRHGQNQIVRMIEAAIAEGQAAPKRSKRSK